MSHKISKDNLGPARSNIIRVGLPPEVAYNLESFQRVQKDILGRLGCMACCSGWDIRFDIFTNFSVDKNLKVREMGNG